MGGVLKVGELGACVVNQEQQRYIEMGVHTAKDKQLDELNSHLKDIAKELHLINKALKGR